MDIPKEFFLYTRITKSQSEELLTLKNPHTLRSLLRSIFITTPTDDKDEVVLDFYTHHIHFCIQHSFSLEKLSCFLGIMDFLFHKSLNSKLLPTTAFEIFKRVLEKHCMQRPPFSIGIFTRENAAIITEYVVSTFFRHYLLYEYAFTPQNDIFITSNSSFTTDLSEYLPLTAGKEFNPHDIPLLEEYFDLQPERHSTERSNYDERNQEDSVSDPVHMLFMQEMMNFRSELTDNIKKQDEVLISKIESTIRAK